VILLDRSGLLAALFDDQRQHDACARVLRESLPTEAQWEFAARGTEGRRYPWGNDEPSAEHAHYNRLQNGTTTVVKSYPRGATPEGIYDLAGNVWEWCRDWSGRYTAEEQRDPLGPEGGAFRVLRGGAFFNGPQSLPAANRVNDLPERKLHFVGFRVAWSGVEK
jgi:formylglycine-generating enzyme required for sulfatase activity